MMTHPRTLLSLGVFLLLAVAGCGTEKGATAPQLATTSLEETSEGLNGAPTATYFRVLGRDRRLCPSPLCGGYYVQRVNLAAGPTYVAAIDYNGLALDPGARAAVERGLGLLRGRLVPRMLGGRSYMVLAVGEAWLSSSGPRPPAGTFYRLQDNGIVCITDPCFSLHLAALNRLYATDVSGLDLTPSGAPAEEIEKAHEALAALGEGILAAGYIRPAPGSVGMGRTFFASQFYMKAAP
jgi:hypothetical protein